MEAYDYLIVGAGLFGEEILHIRRFAGFRISAEEKARSIKLRKQLYMRHCERHC